MNVCILFGRESYEVGRDCSGLGAVKQARTLRLLAHALLDHGGEGEWQKALNAVSLANSEHSHPAGFLLKTNILLKHDGGNERLAQCKSTLISGEISYVAQVSVENCLVLFLSCPYSISPFQVLTLLCSILTSLLKWGYPQYD